jgi:antitoxin component of MazEF toxin-antitoxin module
MHVKAQKWGNSLAVRMPKAVAADAVGIRENDVFYASNDNALSAGLAWLTPYALLDWRR